MGLRRNMLRGEIPLCVWKQLFWKILGDIKVQPREVLTPHHIGELRKTTSSLTFLVLLESGSDGIDWKPPIRGNQFHPTGWYLNQGIPWIALGWH